MKNQEYILNRKRGFIFHQKAYTIVTVIGLLY